MGRRVFVVVRGRANGASSWRCLPHQSGSIRIAGCALRRNRRARRSARRRKRSAALRCGSARARISGAFVPGLGACDPAWSPDGRRLAVTAAEGLWVFPANSSEGALRVESRLPLGSIEFNYRAFSSPRWSPDGALLGTGRHQRRHVVGGSVRGQQRQALLHVSARERHLHLDGRARAEARRPRNSPAQTMTSSTVRHAYLDWVRGVAVLIMIEAHVLDAWTQCRRSHAAAVRLRDDSRRVRRAAVSLSRRPGRRAVGRVEASQDGRFRRHRGGRCRSAGGRCSASRSFSACSPTS